MIDIKLFLDNPLKRKEYFDKRSNYIDLSKKYEEVEEEYRKYYTSMLIRDELKSRMNKLEAFLTTQIVHLRKKLGKDFESIFKEILLNTQKSTFYLKKAREKEKELDELRQSNADIELIKERTSEFQIYTDETKNYVKKATEITQSSLRIIISDEEKNVLLQSIKIDINAFKQNKNNYKAVDLLIFNDSLKKIESLNKIIDNVDIDYLALHDFKITKFNKLVIEYDAATNKHYKLFENLISYMPNLPESEVKNGKDENDNVILFEVNKPNKKLVGKMHHEIIEKLDLLYKEEAINISGPRHLIYKNKLAELVNAVEQFMIETHLDKKIQQIEPPVIVNERALFNTGQLPKFEEDLYKLNNGQYLIPTAEVPLTNIAVNKIYKEDELPIKMFAMTSCFRSEAGSAGRDTIGMIRVHQFRKTELVTIGKPADSKKDFDEMLHQATHILDLLEISYRVVELCTGDMGFASQRTYDIEVWLPGAEKYREISSVSCCGDFQARRMNAKYQTADKKKELVFTYNGSALAVERTIAAIIENYYDEKQNAIIVPQVLRKYLKFDKITK